MKLHRGLHDWDISYGEARRLQEELAGEVRLTALPDDIKKVAGADMAIDNKKGLFYATVVVMTFPSMEILETVVAKRDAHFPYVPGLLSFREAPCLLDAFSKLHTSPDVVIFDGQGIAHPRRLGLASHMGLWLGIPTIGCAKSRLVGEYEEPGREKGEWSPLFDKGERIGTVLRTRTGVKPVFVSPGHLCNHKGARRLVLRCAVRYKLPEPTRQAHLTVTEVRRCGT